MTALRDLSPQLPTARWGTDWRRGIALRFQDRTRFSPSRPSARRFAPCSASRLRRALTAALPRAALSDGQSRPGKKDEDSLMNTSTISLIAHFADGSERPATGEEIIAVARDYMSRRVRRGTQLGSPKAAREFLSLKLGTLEREVFAVIFLDKRHRLITYQEMFQGTIDGASVHPREVVKEALKQNAAAVILAHPHPSGVAEPSQADELITKRLKDALDLVDIRVLDHIIIAGGDAISLSERGLL
jgi:DNA repair protein RadC